MLLTMVAFSSFLDECKGDASERDPGGRHNNRHPGHEGRPQRAAYRQRAAGSIRITVRHDPIRLHALRWRQVGTGWMPLRQCTRLQKSATTSSSCQSVDSGQSGQSS